MTHISRALCEEQNACRKRYTVTQASNARDTTTTIFLAGYAGYMIISWLIQPIYFAVNKAAEECSFYSRHLMTTHAIALRSEEAAQPIFVAVQRLIRQLPRVAREREILTAQIRREKDIVQHTSAPLRNEE